MNDNVTLKTQLHCGAVWEYKGIEYRILYVDVDLRSQHPVSGQWDASVIYTTLHPPFDRAAAMRFVRTGTEFIEKFRYVRSS